MIILSLWAAYLELFCFSTFQHLPNKSINEFNRRNRIYLTQMYKTDDFYGGHLSAVKTSSFLSGKKLAKVSPIVSFISSTWVIKWNKMKSRIKNIKWFTVLRKFPVKKRRYTHVYVLNLVYLCYKTILFSHMLGNVCKCKLRKSKIQMLFYFFVDVYIV